MKCNENKFCNFTQILPLHVIVNVFLVRLQTNTLPTRDRSNVSSMLLFQPPVHAGYLFERQYRYVYEHRVPYVKEILLRSI